MQTQNYGNDPSLSDSAGAEPRVTLDRAASTAHETVDRVHRRAAQVSDRVATEGDRMYHQACDWVAGHPIQAVAGALVAGYLFGRIRR